MKDVLVENRAKWRQPPVTVGDRAFVTLPVPSNGVLPTLAVTMPDGDRVELEVRRRDDGLTSDYCAVLEDTSQEGRYRYIFTLARGKQARGAFNVNAPGKRGRR